MWRHDDDDDGACDARLVAVTDALADIERPGVCFVSGVLSHFPLPGLSVEGLGEVRFPLGERDAKELAARCHLAPYGHGEQTIVDTQVHNSWELNGDQFSLANPKWRTVIDAIVTAIRAPLGISETTEYDAQLYKMMLYEEGGMFHKHQDSEKETGMFGTLVVMLPCSFTGGELIVNPPAVTAAAKEPHVWDPAMASPYDLKYAAFYGDCEHEVKPVLSGYRSCLTYNLVTRTTTHVPRFAGNHELYHQLEVSLQNFFKYDDDNQKNKRQRISLHQSVPRRSVSLGRSELPQQRDCQLVYVLEHKYTNPGLSFAYLKNKDHLIAQCLAKFCGDNNGAFSLYLCKVKYTYEFDPDCDDEETIEKSVALESPWVRYGEHTTVPCRSMAASLEAEIAPAGFFEEVPFDGYANHGYTGNAGSRAEKWYTSAAIVLQPLMIELEQTARAGMDYAVNKWIKMVEDESKLAEPFASTVFAPERRWSTDDLCFVPCLKAVRRLNNVDVFGDVLHSLPRFAFQEAIAATVEHFGWEQCKEVIFEVAERSQFRNRVNLSQPQANSGDPVEDPFLARYYKAPASPTDVEYARILELALRVSVDKLREYLETTETNVLIKMMAPSLVAFVKSLGEGCPAEVTESVRSVITQLRSRMPRAGSWGISHIRLHGGRICCQHCNELQMFLSSPRQQTLRSTMNKQLRHHIHEVIEAYCGDRLTHITDRPSTLVMTKQLPAVDLHDVAQNAIRSLCELIGDADDPPPLPIPSARTQEIIEIDSD